MTAPTRAGTIEALTGTTLWASLGVVALGLAVAGVLGVVVWTFVAMRSFGSSGHGMGGLGVLATAYWAIVAVPLGAVVCSVLAWLVSRHPPPPLAWGIVVAALCAAGVAPVLVRPRSPAAGPLRGDASTRSAPAEQCQEPDLSSR